MLSRSVGWRGRYARRRRHRLAMASLWYGDMNALVDKLAPSTTAEEVDAYHARNSTNRSFTVLVIVWYLHRVYLYSSLDHMLDGSMMLFNIMVARKVVYTFSRFVGLPGMYALRCGRRLAHCCV